MKKQLLLVCMMLVCTVSAWAGYGILLNGNTLYEATHKGVNGDGYDEYYAHVNVKNGDYCQLINTTNDDKWAVNLNTYSVSGFTRDGDKIKISVTGCYDFYIQLKWGADQLYVGNGSDCGSGETYYPYITPPGGKKIIKLVPSEEWKVADAKYAAWIWGKNIAESHWTDFFEAVSAGNDTLQVEFDAAADSIDFVRFSPKTEKPRWDNKDKEVWGESKTRVNYSSLVWTVKGWSDGTWYAVPKPTETFGLNIDGVYMPGKKNVLQTEWKEYMLRGVELTAGQKIKVENGETHDQWVISKYASTSYQFEVKDGAYVVKEDGKYDFYLKFIFENDEIFISKEGTYTTAVRDQCTDVMMQAFFNNSYDDNAPGVGDDKYHLNLGNTKWATLTPQASEIGHYFDLVWLPPSANGDGMGYHPKNYCDQNSEWGTRAELETLIEALHNAGSKVIADIVINHCAGTTTWCDFPELDFGEFGTFHPDVTYICRNDEVNAEWNKGKAEVSCWGKASGSYDDGENWDGARDWSHDNVYVQEMFKAYLKWILKVMKYDGFRYDKGDGFNNWHHDNYNKASNPYIAFMESYNGDDRIIEEIEKANRNLMALDFQTKWRAFDGIAGFDYSKCKGSGLLGRGYAKYAVTFIESHDWFLRDDNENEFGGRGKSLTPELKDRLLQANAFLLGMPGIPCVFYPHWKKYKEELKPMIEARKLAGIHSESAVSDEQAEQGGYQCTLKGKYGWLILQLGNKTKHEDQAWDPNYQLKAKGNGYAMWVNRTEPLGVEQTECDAPKAQKMLRDGQLLILRDGQTYTVTGQRVK